MPKEPLIRWREHFELAAAWCSRWAVTATFVRFTRRLEGTFRRIRRKPLPAPRNFFPSVSEYSIILETHGFEVRMRILFDRPTPLEGDRGMEQWIRQFSSFYLDELPASLRQIRPSRGR